MKFLASSKSDGIRRHCRRNGGSAHDPGGGRSRDARACRLRRRLADRLCHRASAPGQPVEKEDLERMEFFQTYWPVFLVGLIIGLIVIYLAFRPKQNVRLTD